MVEYDFEENSIIDTGYGFITEDHPFEHLEDLED